MKQWKCQICGYIHKGEEPPDKCPVCGADKTQFILLTSEPEPVTPPKAVETPEAVAAGTTAGDPGKPAAAKPFSIRTPAELFDFIAEQVLKYHLHPISAHVPNGVIPISVIFVVIAMVFQCAAWDQAAYYNLIFVILSMPAVAFTGYIEWQKRYGGNITSVFFIKMICAAVVLLTAFIAVAWRMVNPDIAIEDSARKLPFLLLHLIMLAAAGVAGHLGGKMVFKD